MTSGLVQSHDIAVLGQNMALLNGILKSILGGLAFYACLSTLSIWELSKKLGRMLGAAIVNSSREAINECGSSSGLLGSDIWALSFLRKYRDQSFLSLPPQNTQLKICANNNVEPGQLVIDGQFSTKALCTH